MPWGPVASLLPPLGVASSSDVSLEASAATSIADFFATLKVLAPLVPPSSAGPDIGQDLSLVATMINANVPTRVWEVNLSSFDTHSGEQLDQNALLARSGHGDWRVHDQHWYRQSSQRRDADGLLGVRPPGDVKRVRRYRPRHRQLLCY